MIVLTRYDDDGFPLCARALPPSLRVGVVFTDAALPDGDGWRVTASNLAAVRDWFRQSTGYGVATIIDEEGDG